MKMNFVIYLCVFVASLNSGSASSLVTPEKSAIVVAFENEYDLSTLANTLSDEGINTVLIIPSSSNNLDDTLVDVEIVRLKVNDEKFKSDEPRALEACESLLTDQAVHKLVEEFSPTYVIAPALRHDACILPWAKKIKSIPVLWTRGSESESYTFHQSGIALPILQGGFWSRLSHLYGLRSTLTSINNNYINPALNLVQKYLPNDIDTLENLYADVDLIFWGSDTILRSEVSAVSQLLVEIGCHHCRGVHPIPSELQKELIEHRTGTIAVLLDEEYKTLIEEIAKGLPQGRQGQAVVWKNKNIDYKDDDKRPENLFVNNEIIRQDLIGYGRTRLLLSHCDDTVFLETGFHGTPVICFPRNSDEAKNSLRAISLGFSIDANGVYTSQNILAIIKTIHETAGYRENARKVSVALRDRPNPPSDRITYWLGYLARNNKEERHIAVEKNRRITYKKLYSIDVWVTIGFIFGLISGAVLPSAYILAGKILEGNNKLGSSFGSKPKRKYKS